MACNMGHIAMQNGLYRIAKWAVSQNNVCFLAGWGGKNRPGISVSPVSEVLKSACDVAVLGLLDRRNDSLQASISAFALAGACGKEYFLKLCTVNN